MGRWLAILVAASVAWWWFIARPGDEARARLEAGPGAIEIRDQDGNPVDLASLPPEVRARILRESGGAMVAPPGPAAAPAREYRLRDRDAEFQSANVSGWTVILERTLTEGERALADRVLATLEKQLDAIAAAVSPDVANELRQVPIWVSHRSGSPRAGMYHWSAEAARQAGEDPRKEGGVEFARALDLVEVSEWEQPWVVLHELAHAWHHRVLGAENAMVRSAFEHARAAGLYDSVKHIGGAQMPHYALTNEREYFAELTEAYFGRNDFFPFNREELRRHDPMGYRMVETAWRIAR